MKVSNPNPDRVIGGIIGDIVGSVYEFANYRAKDFELFADYHGHKCFATDDSIMTLAICKAVMNSKSVAELEQNAVRYMREVGKPYPYCGYGGRFMDWMYSDYPVPYNSFGNGAAMRVSPVAYAASSLEEAEGFAGIVTRVTHNHPEGIKGAKATAGMVWLALNGYSKEQLDEYACSFYDIEFTLDEIRPTYRFNETCQETVPQAFEAFLESSDFEDAIRNAISVGGDSDTLACITGSIAGAYYGVPKFLEEKAITFLDDRLKCIYDAFAKNAD